MYNLYTFFSLFCITAALLSSRALQYLIKYRQESNEKQENVFEKSNSAERRLSLPWLKWLWNALYRAEFLLASSP